MNVGDVVKMPAAPTRKGYKFVCWKGSELHPGDNYKVEGDHTFTAIWKKSAGKGVSGTLIAKMKTKGKTALIISWSKIKGAKGYDVFFVRCAHKDKKTVCKKVKTIKGNKKFKWTKKCKIYVFAHNGV